MIILSQYSKRWRTFLVVDIFCKLQKLMEKNGILVTLDSKLEEYTLLKINKKIRGAKVGNLTIL